MLGFGAPHARTKFFQLANQDSHVIRDDITGDQGNAMVGRREQRMGILDKAEV